MSNEDESRGRRINAVSTNRTRPWLLLSAVVAIMLMLAGCGGDGDDDAETKSEGTSTTSNTEDGSGGTTDGTAPDSTEGSTEGEELDSDLPRTIDYGFLTFEITEAEQLDEHPYEVTQTDPEKNYVGLTMTVTNRVDDAEYTVYPTNFLLEAGEEKSDDAFNQEQVVEVGAGDDADAEMWFPLDKSTDLSELVLVISEPNYEPARLPLTGDELTTSVEVEGEPATITNAGQELTINGGGTIDFNQSVNDGEVGPDVEPSQLGRAPEGVAYLHLPGVAVDSSDTSFYVGQNYQFSPTYTVDGGPTNGKTSWYDEAVENKTREGEFTIQLPAGSQELVIKIDYKDANQADESFTYTVDVSSMSDLDIASS